MSGIQLIIRQIQQVASSLFFCLSFPESVSSGFGIFSSDTIARYCFVNSF